MALREAKSVLSVKPAFRSGQQAGLRPIFNEK